MKIRPNFQTLLFVFPSLLLVCQWPTVITTNLEESPPKHAQAHLNRALQTSLKYTGSSCKVQGPTTGQAVMNFFAFGDTPYDAASGPPLFQGADYRCLKSTILPGMKQRAGVADFVVHVGDVKAGSSIYSSYCNDALLGNRRDLFQTLEPDIDFFIVPGDNEWNECQGYSSTPSTADVAKTTWRKNFAEGSFVQFGRTTLPSGETAPSVIRPSDQPQNFFFYYSTHAIAFFGITEPYGDSKYDSINAKWVSTNLAGILSSNRPLKAIVITGHGSLSSSVLKELDRYKTIPTLYVKGDDHVYCFRFLNNKKYPKLVELTVASNTVSPFLVSLVKDASSGEYFFSVTKQSFGCS